MKAENSLKQTLLGFALALTSVGVLACASSTNTNGSPPATSTAAPSVAPRAESLPTPNSAAIKNESSKIGTLTGQRVITVDGTLLIVRLDDGRQKAIPSKNPITGQQIPDDARVEVRPEKDAKNGEWELVRIVKARR